MLTSLLLKPVCILFLLFASGTEKEYLKEYYSSGVLKAEGWTNNNVREGYWIYYYPEGTEEKKGHYHKGKKHGYWYFYSHNGQPVKEGHFMKGKMNDWWTFYENDTKLKVQYSDGKRNGFGLVYQSKKLQKAIKFEEDKKVGEWTSIISFKRDNPQVRF
jgi:antitoxin component YwqK of YwqJK toxin-antitoxin module